MLFLYFSWVSAVWWDFAHTDFETRAIDSFEHPFFAVCTSPTCPHCRGISTLFQKFSQSLGPRSSVVFTHIDCTTSDICARAEVRGVPAFVLMRGASSRYWLTAYGRSTSEWSKLLHSHVGISAEERPPKLSETVKGATSFHLISPPIDREIVRQFKKLSGSYRVFNNSFTFEFDSELRKTKVIAYRSPNCSISAEIRVKGMKACIERNKFGDLHHYDLEEWNSVSDETPFGLFVVKRELGSGGMRSLLTFSEHFCGQMNFGWSSFASETGIGDLTSTTERNTPFLLLTNKNNEGQNFR
jgi:thiol-disulfide isomerase/thioredoxin